MIGKFFDKKIFVGFDGFVDTIVQAVDVRDITGYRPIRRIADFGNRILSAAGKSSNIELVPQRRSIGGNGPLMANALCKLGGQVRYMGAIGDCKNNIFRDFAQTTSAISIGNYSETRAVEFDDGKILFGEMMPLQEITVDSILAKISSEELINVVDSSDAVAITNWTMIPHMTEIVQFFLTDILPNCSTAGAQKIFFFDLADPEKRHTRELVEFLEKITQMQRFGRSILGLNLREASQVLRALGEEEGLTESRASLIDAAQLLQKILQIDAVFIHGMKIFAISSGSCQAFSEGYFVEKPMISTGAGDHCNAGLLAAYLCGNDLAYCVHFSAAASAFYVKYGFAPTWEEVQVRL